MMPAGVYYIGDLCYVLNDSWDELCNIIIRGEECIEGEFSLSDSRKFVIYNTAYGDGSYLDNHNNEYDVDSGSIGCILLNKIDFSNNQNSVSFGHLKTFKEPFETSSENGIIYFDDVAINTNDYATGLHDYSDLYEEDEDYEYGEGD